MAMVDNDWLQGLDEEDQFLARIVGAESEEDYEAIPVSVRNAWRNTYRNIEDKEQSLESLKKAGVIDDDIYNSAKAAGYDGENFSDITPEQWREIYNGYIDGYNSFAKEHPDVPYRFRNQDRFRSQWDESYEGYVGKQQGQNAQPSQPTEATQETQQQEEVEPLEVSDVPNKPFPEANAQEPARVRMQMGEPRKLETPKENAQPKQVTLPEEEQEEYRRNGGIFDIARGARNDEPAQVEEKEEPVKVSPQPAEKAATQGEATNQEGRGNGYNIFDDLRQIRKEEENPQQGQQQTTEQPKQGTTQTQNNEKLPEEEQQEYVDRGGVMPMSGTNDSYSRQRRNRNVEPVKQADNAVGASAGNTAGNAASTTAVAGTEAEAGTDGSAEEEIVMEEVKPIKQEAPKVVQVTDNGPRPRTTPVHIQTREEWEAEQAENVAAGTAKSGTNGVRTPAERTTPVVKPVGTAKEQGEAGMTRQREQPATTNAGNTQTSVADYQGIIDYINRLNKAADDEEAEGKRADEEKVKRAGKRRMLLAGIADAANSFHQAYAYARGIKPMNDNKGYAKEVKKEIRDDLEWMRKNKDRVLNFRAKAAEMEKALASLKNQDRLRDQQEAAQQYRYDRLKLDIQKAADTKALNEKKLEIQEMLAIGRINKMQHDMLMAEIDKKIKQQNADTATARENRMSQGSTTTTTEDDGTGLTTTKTQVKQVGTSGASGNSNAGTSKGTGYGKQSKGTGYDK